MVYSQASRAEIISQDPFISILFIWSIIAFVEGMNWRSRYIDPGEGSPPLMWRKQAAFTLAFLGAGSIISYLPYIISGEMLNIYESTTVMGKGLIGLLLLVPLAIAAVVKGFVENRRGN
jgi:hypothetical protein